MLSSWIFILIGLCIFVFGLMIFLGGSKSKALAEGELVFKNGKPITPRHERTIQETQETPETQSRDALSDLANIAEQHQANHCTATNTDSDIAIEEESKELNIKDFNSKPSQSTSTQAVQGNEQNTDQSHKAEQNQEVTPPKKEPASHNPTQSTVSLKHLFEPDVLPKSEFEIYDKPVVSVDTFFVNEERLSEQNNDVLRNYKKTVNILIRPKDSFAGVDGKSVLKIARQYALKFGELNLFHRYEDPRGVGMLWFSMAGLSVDGLVQFDLVATPETNYRGLTFFLSLPHPQALQGFDSMIQIAYSVAVDLNADICDAYGDLLNNDNLQLLRQSVSEYQG